MNLFLANPWGLLALLGIPAILLIHLLRRKSRRVAIGTMFLVESVLPSSEGGRRIRHIRNSLPLWLQLLAVVILSLVLAQPRWIDRTSSQTVVAVLDSSASMSAFRDQVLSAAAGELARHERAAAHTQWIFLNSDASRLASGASLEDVISQAAAAWKPNLGSHDSSEAFRLARTLAGRNGAVVYFTDHKPGDDASGVDWVASGEPIANAGFVGVASDERGWTALVNNFGGPTREIRWRIPGSPWQPLTLAAGQAAELSGEFPAGGNRVELELEPDRFTLDDKLPIIRRQRKPFFIGAREDEDFRPLFAQITSLENTHATRPDITLEVYDPLSPTPAKGPSIVFLKDSNASAKPLPGFIVAENDPLMRDLNWHGLIVRDSFGIPMRDGDVPLLWQGDRLLVFLRPGESVPSLMFSFDVLRSNAARLPAFALLIHRFLKNASDLKPMYEAANVETRQEIRVAGKGRVPAPAEPSFFDVASDETGLPLFGGAARFADPRESDFASAASARNVGEDLESVVQSRSIGAFLDPLWMALLAGLMIANWALAGKSRNFSPVTAPR